MICIERVCDLPVSCMWLSANRSGRSEGSRPASKKHMGRGFSNPRNRSSRPTALFWIRESRTLLDRSRLADEDAVDESSSRDARPELRPFEVGCFSMMCSAPKTFRCGGKSSAGAPRLPISLLTTKTLGARRRLVAPTSGRSGACRVPGVVCAGSF